MKGYSVVDLNPLQITKKSWVHSVHQLLRIRPCANHMHGLLGSLRELAF